MRVSFNIYSLAYSAGFYRPNGRLIKYQRPECFFSLAQKSGLKSLEIPLDKYFRSLNSSLADDFFLKAKNAGINIFPCIEDFDPQFLTESMSKLKAYDMGTIRIKMPHLGPTFYGGNRYSSGHFWDSLKAFKLQLKVLDPILDNFDCFVAIENHQDLDLTDLLSICEASKSSRQFITWDVGNSLSTMRTPCDFMDKAADLIANIHMKDYRVFECEKGFALSRCNLGDGMIPTCEIIKSTKNMPNLQNISMELAAHPDRICDFNNPNYAKSFSHSKCEIRQFSRYLKSIILNDERGKSALKDEDLISLEINQSLSSCNKLRELYHA